MIEDPGIYDGFMGFFSIVTFTILIWGSTVIAT